MSFLKKLGDINEGAAGALSVGKDGRILRTDETSGGGFGLPNTDAEDLLRRIG